MISRRFTRAEPSHSMPAWGPRHTGTLMGSARCKAENLIGGQGAIGGCASYRIGEVTRNPQNTGRFAIDRYRTLTGTLLLKAGSGTIGANTHGQNRWRLRGC